MNVALLVMISSICAADETLEIATTTAGTLSKRDEEYPKKAGLLMFGDGVCTCDNCKAPLEMKLGDEARIRRPENSHAVLTPTLGSDISVVPVMWPW